MRIAPQLGHFYFSHNPKEVRPLKDIFDVFHGRYVCTKTHFGLDQFTYRTDGGEVAGESIPLGGIDWNASATDVRIPRLEAPGQAARWTALEAYNHLYHQQYETDSPFKGFLGMRGLGIIAPDQRCLKEWGERKESDFSVVPVYDERNLEDDTELSMFQARGDTLLSAAQTMANYYAELSAMPDLDPSLAALDASVTIGQALGATSMEHLAEVWNEAIAQPDPVAAARQVYHNLTA